MASEQEEAAIELGSQAATFLQTKVGLFLTERAEAEEREALEELATVDPTDVKRIRDLQNQAWRANSVMSWIAETINNAVGIHQGLQEQERLPE